MMMMKEMNAMSEERDDEFADKFYERFMNETLAEMSRCNVDINEHAIAHAIMIAEAFIANAIEDSSEKQVLKQQIKTLREAIKRVD